MTPDSTPLQSYENLARVLASAQRDHRVRGILLDIDSPGGEADGVFDFANKVQAAQGSKPIWAIANHAALSAAYVIASAADRVWTTQTAAVGSLGVVALHADQSEFDAQEGLKYTYLFRGARKIDANPHAPLTPEAQAVVQSEVDRVYGLLIDQVARQRRMEPARLRDTEAAVYFGSNGVERGLADRLGSLEDAHAALVEHVTPKGRAMMNGPDAPADAATAAAGDDNVVQLRAAAAGEARRDAAEILAICQLAARGQPWGIELAGQLLAEGASREVAMRRAQERQAGEAQTRQIVAIDASSAERVGRQRNTRAELDRAAGERFRAQSLGLMPGETINPTASWAGRAS
jgi:signal peptide peptidase SppA